MKNKKITRKKRTKREKYKPNYNLPFPDKEIINNILYKNGKPIKKLNIKKSNKIF